MIAAGCDVGSLTAKAVILEGDAIIGTAVIPASASPERSARDVMERALAAAGRSMEDVARCVGTGYGRKRVSFVQGVESEIECHARGALWRAPSVRTVIDIGGQDAKAIRIGDDGRVARYIYNDKCASGTGRFLEIIAEALDVGLDSLGGLSAKSSNRIALSSQCVVFAETEIISLVNEGTDIADIVGALHRAVANRAAALARSITVERDVAFTGGVAKNAGMVAALGRALGADLIVVEHPQVNGALGAALIARDFLENRT